MRVEPGHLSGTIIPPPSKSDAHRALICSRLAAQIELPEGLGRHWSDDIKATDECLQRLLGNSDLPLNCGESGTTLRLLVPVAAALGRDSTFAGHGRLPARPMKEYQDILHGHGVELEMPSGLSLPLKIQGKLEPGVFYAPGHISSQYISGMLLALPLLAGDSELILTSGLQSAPYVDMTLGTMAAYGVTVEEKENGWSIRGGQKYSPAVYKVEADYSQAAFWLTAAFGGNNIEVEGLRAGSVQGDRAIISLLADFGRGLESYTIDVSQIPDLVPILAVAASLVPARTELVNAARLRLKESDRLQSTEEALSGIGIDIKQHGDGLVIYGGRPLEGGRASGHNDHRIVMALAIAALFSKNGVEIVGAQAVNKSYPDFFLRLKELGGSCYELNLG
ncbi:MAG: 3-phosphoshikimate 1-carboxyvinyltransferase [Clostridiaceae bacterium]|nr:3-phosphoshikimate 1-carboxyvinyltransferase [Clostridiaceae bacterium]